MTTLKELIKSYDTAVSTADELLAQVMTEFQTLEDILTALKSVSPSARQRIVDALWSDPRYLMKDGKPRLSSQTVDVIKIWRRHATRREDV